MQMEKCKCYAYTKHMTKRFDIWNSNNVSALWNENQVVSMYKRKKEENSWKVHFNSNQGSGCDLGFGFALIFS